MISSYTVMYIDPITRQSFNSATSISCDNNPPIVIASDFVNDKHNILKPKPVSRATLAFFEAQQFPSPRSLIVFTAQGAGYFSHAEVTNFSNRLIVIIHSDTTLKLLDKATAIDFSYL